MAPDGPEVVVTSPVRALWVPSPFEGLATGGSLESLVPGLTQVRTRSHTRHTHAHTHLGAHSHVHSHTSTWVCTHTHTYVCSLGCTPSHTHAHLGAHTHTHAHPLGFVLTLTSTWVCTHTLTHAHLGAYTHVHLGVHSHTHLNTPPWVRTHTHTCTSRPVGDCKRVESGRHAHLRVPPVRERTSGSRPETGVGTGTRHTRSRTVEDGEVLGFREGSGHSRLGPWCWPRGRVYVPLTVVCARDPREPGTRVETLSFNRHPSPRRRGRWRTQGDLGWRRRSRVLGERPSRGSTGDGGCGGEETGQVGATDLSLLCDLVGRDRTLEDDEE